MAETTRNRNSGEAFVLLKGDRPLPHDADAEMAVLGCMLLEPECAIDLAMARLNFENAFFTPAHQKIFTLLVRLRNEMRRDAIDLITVSNALTAEGLLEQLMNVVPSSANIEQYVEIVRENAVLRRLIRTGCEVAERSFDPQERSVRELVEAVRRDVDRHTRSAR